VAKADSFPASGKTGGTTGALEYSKKWKKRRAKKLRDEEKYWASLASEVTVTYKVPNT
jgi:hypothetical protein